MTISKLPPHCGYRHLGALLKYEQATNECDWEAEQKLHLDDEIWTGSNSDEIIARSGDRKVALHEVSIVAPTNSSPDFGRDGEPNERMEPIHDRMTAFLEPRDYTCISGTSREAMGGHHDCRGALAAQSVTQLTEFNGPQNPALEIHGMRFNADIPLVASGGPP